MKRKSYMNKNNDNTSNEKYVNLQNVGIIDFNLDKQTPANIKLDKKIIKQASDIFAKDLIEFFENNGDVKEMTIDNVYAHKDIYSN